MKRPKLPPAEMDSYLSKLAEQVKIERDAREGFWEDAHREVPEVLHYRRLGREGILNDTLAKRSYLKLLAAGLRQTQLFEALLGTAVSGKKVDWLKDLGKTQKQLTYFPGRLESIAGEIDQLNRHRLFAPGLWVQRRRLPDSSKKKFTALFEQLPHLIRCYAAFLGSHSKDLRKYSKRNKGDNRNVRTWAQDVLIHLIFAETGKDRPAELSILLSAVASRGNAKRPEYSPEAIRMRTKRLRDRYPKA